MQADCHVKQTEPYSSWQNPADSTTRELKKGAGRKMIKSNFPTSETMQLHTTMTNEFWEDGLVVAPILAQHCVQRS